MSARPWLSDLVVDDDDDEKEQVLQTPVAALTLWGKDKKDWTRDAEARKQNKLVVAERCNILIIVVDMNDVLLLDHCRPI